MILLTHSHILILLLIPMGGPAIPNKCKAAVCVYQRLQSVYLSDILKCTHMGQMVDS